jgi:hypothetical protein
MTKVKGIRVETNQYERSHGRKPKGAGGWAFEVDGQMIVRHGRTYAEARDQAVAAAKLAGAESLIVLP